MIGVHVHWQDDRGIPVSRYDEQLRTGRTYVHPALTHRNDLAPYRVAQGRIMPLCILFSHEACSECLIKSDPLGPNAM